MKKFENKVTAESYKEDISQQKNIENVENNDIENLFNSLSEKLQIRSIYLEELRNNNNQDLWKEKVGSIILGLIGNDKIEDIRKNSIDLEKLLEEAKSKADEINEEIINLLPQDIYNTLNGNRNLLFYEIVIDLSVLLTIKYTIENVIKEVDQALTIKKEDISDKLRKNIQYWKQNKKDELSQIIETIKSLPRFNVIKIQKVYLKYLEKSKQEVTKRIQRNIDLKTNYFKCLYQGESIALEDYFVIMLSEMQN